MSSTTILQDKSAASDFPLARTLGNLHAAIKVTVKAPNVNSNSTSNSSSKSSNSGNSNNSGNSYEDRSRRTFDDTSGMAKYRSAKTSFKLRGSVSLQKLDEIRPWGVREDSPKDRPPLSSWYTYGYGHTNRHHIRDSELNFDHLDLSQDAHGSTSKAGKAIDNARAPTLSMPDQGLLEAGQTAQQSCLSRLAAAVRFLVSGPSWARLFSRAGPARPESQGPASEIGATAQTKPVCRASFQRDHNPSQINVPPRTQPIPIPQRRAHQYER